MLTPREFIATFVDPAIELWRTEQLVPHLAIHAVAQLDILAEVVARHTMARPLKRREAGRFRQSLAEREPVLAVIRDIHDAHKHGELERGDAGAKEGQRPEIRTQFGFFAGHTAVGGPLTPYKNLVFTHDNGQRYQVGHVILEARLAWDRELQKMESGLHPRPDA